MEGLTMFFHLGVRDFLDRAEQVYPDRIAVVDEPDQPAASWGSLTYQDVARLARGLAAGLDALGIAAGARVAIVSHNAARLLVSFFGVSGWGRVLVPVNFRLAPAEIRYIVEHSGAEVLLVDPELRHLLDTVTAKHVFVLGDSDEEVFGHTAEPISWEGDESATATLNYTSGTTARPKGVQLTHRNLWINATVLALHVTLSDNSGKDTTDRSTDRRGLLLSRAVSHVGGRTGRTSTAEVTRVFPVRRRVDR
jgi:acyl-CoA synthetase (AMP-forming)/AMP-acid ligase II